VAGYNTFKIHSTINGIDNSGTEDDWIAPSLGCPIKMITDMQVSGVNLHIIITMTSKNF
jgi:hypothetical protein